MRKSELSLRIIHSLQTIPKKTPNKLGADALLVLSNSLIQANGKKENIPSHQQQTKDNYFTKNKQTQKTPKGKQKASMYGCKQVSSRIKSQTRTKEYLQEKNSAKKVVSWLRSRSQRCTNLIKKF